MKRKIGDKALFNGEEVTLVEIHKGAKTNKPVMQSGCVFVGYASKVPSYTLSNGKRVSANNKLLKFLYNGH